MVETDDLPGSLNLTYLDQLYADYLRSPESVAPDWRSYFDRQGPASVARGRVNLATTDGNGAAGSMGHQARQECVDLLIQNYRMRGHIIAHMDPLGIERPLPHELDPAFYGFTEADLDHPYSTSALGGGDVHSLREILDRLRNTYCRSIGVQFMHIDDLGMRNWLQVRMESTENRLKLTRAEQLRILTRLTDAVVFEEFLHKKYQGAKSFSLEGAESLIPLLDLVIEKAAGDGVEEIVLAMAHRGRLNVLANILGKHPYQIFREFEDRDPELYVGRGDVKYHLGHSADWQTATGRKVHVSLCFNPSHLEFVNPVAVGRLRAKQDRFGDQERTRGMVLLMHGDAGFAGEGVIQETLNLSELAAYRVGGTVHVIVNNQIGFTTLPGEGRSCTYATDVARMLPIPIFHVNGEDPEAVAQVVLLALDFRRTFQRDTVIDMYCYRVRGHNEGDEPTFTQPMMYRAIRSRQSVRAGYLEHLLKHGEVTRAEADRIAQERRELLEKDLAVARSDEYVRGSEEPAGIWAGYLGGSEHEKEPKTGVAGQRLATLLQQLCVVPADFHAHPKIQRLLQQRREMAEGKRSLDWAAAEALAFATLATDGMRVRISGQDSARGTFSQRHAVLHDVEDGHTYMPLQHLAAKQAQVEIINSPLSEAGVLGFEYGYSLDSPDCLVLWEAQFGDFVNAGQVIIDQFIASAEDKWRRLSGLVLLLPHGFEGQGPEHSSARLERFLTLAAEDNLQVVYPTTPAQYFHCLRRQMIRKSRTPLVVMTPKSLLRHPGAVSSLDQCAQGRFQRVLPDTGIEDSSREVQRVLLCSGKIYYDLDQQRQELKCKDVAIVRLEQLYPLSLDELQSALANYAGGTPVYWVQEEPRNMGAWYYLHDCLGDNLFERLPFAPIARPASASPATGSASSHKLEQARLLKDALGVSNHVSGK